MTKFLSVWIVKTKEAIGLRTAIPQTLIDEIIFFENCKCIKSREEINALKRYALLHITSYMACHEMLS